MPDNLFNIPEQNSGKVDNLFDIPIQDKQSIEGEDLFGVTAQQNQTNVANFPSFESSNNIEDFIGSDRYKDIPRATLEVGANVLGGAALWIPSQVARYSNVVKKKLDQAISRDVLDLAQSGEIDKLTPEQLAKANKIVNMSPEDIQVYGKEIEKFVGSFGGLMPEVRTESGKRIMENVEKVIHTITAPARWAGQFIPEEYPNLRDFVTTLGELATFHYAGKLGSKAKDKILVKQNEVKGKLESGDFIGAEKDLEGFFNNELDPILKDATKDLPEPPGPKATAQEKQNYINRIYRDEIIEGELSTVDYGAHEFKGDQPKEVTTLKIANITEQPNIPITPEVPQYKIGLPEAYSTALERQRYIDRVFRKQTVESELADAPYGFVEKTRLEQMRDNILEGKRQEAITRISEIQQGRYREDELEYRRSRSEQLKKELSKEKVIPDGYVSVSAKEFRDKLLANRAEKTKIVEPVKKELETKIKEEDLDIPPELKDEVSKDEIFEEYREDPYNEFDMYEGKDAEFENNSEYGRDYYDSLFDPLYNEDGAIKVAEIFNSFRHKKTKEERNKVLSIKDLSDKEITKLKAVDSRAKELGISVEEVLKQQGYGKETISKLSDLIAETKSKRSTRKDSYNRSKIKDLADEDVIKPIPGEQIINKNSTTPVSKSWLEAIKNIRKVDVPKAIDFFTTSDTLFRSLPKEFQHLKYHAWKKELDIKNEMKNIKKEISDLQKQFPDKEGRIEVAKRILAKNKHGKEALESMGEMVTDKFSEYDAMETVLENKYKELFDRVNSIRESIGIEKIKSLDNYMPFYTQHHWLDGVRDLFNFIRTGDTGKGRARYRQKEMQLANDTNAAIAYRHSPEVVEAMNFKHKKRTFLDPKTRLDLDPLSTYLKYAEEATTYINMSPLNSFVKELIQGSHKDPETGKVYNLSKTYLGDALGRWSNTLAGVPNFIVPRWIEKGARKISNNLTAARLLLNARTIGVQFTALHPTVVEFGLGKTLNGIKAMVENPKDIPVNKSYKLPLREFDAIQQDIISIVTNNKLSKSMEQVKNFGVKLLSYADGIAARATWYTAWKDIEPLIKSGKMSQKEGIRFADEAVVRTQASGSKSDISPAQMNAIGRAATLWQTYTINHINWIAKDVLGIRNPELKPKDTITRVGRYVMGMAAISAIFEGMLGVESPVPDPGRAAYDALQEGKSEGAVALATLLESLEFLPVTSSFKYGSHIGGPVADWGSKLTKIVSGNDILYKDLIPKAANGDYKAILILGDFIGTTLGVPGTGQAAKYLRNRSRGQGHLESIIGVGSKDRYNNQNISGGFTSF